MVVLREYERGWGNKDFAAHAYETYEEAKAYADSVNSENTQVVVPDYYITARIIQDPTQFSYYKDLL